MVQQTSIVVLLDVLDERHTFHEFSKMKLCSHNAFSQFFQLTFRAQKFENMSRKYEERGSPSLSCKIWVLLKHLLLPVKDGCQFTVTQQHNNPTEKLFVHAGSQNIVRK